MKYVISLVAFLAACATPGENKSVEDCTSYGERTSKALSSRGFELRDGKTVIAKNGVAIFGIFVNEKSGTVIVDAMVDNEQLAKEGEKEGAKRTGSCMRGDHEWITLQLEAPIDRKNEI